jgi:hypothetical protein
MIAIGCAYVGQAILALFIMVAIWLDTAPKA